MSSSASATTSEIERGTSDALDLISAVAQERGTMGPMPLNLCWTDLVIRLASTVVAGLAIGYNREEHGKAAGMRTTLIVCLAACVAMIQVNLLLPLSGRPSDSFVMNDLMRLPLGILTGVGFIGAGAILHRSNMVVGVTTAATLWLVTMIGLCFGGGQIVLGWTTTGLGIAALWALGPVERRVRRQQTGYLTIECDPDGPTEADLRGSIRSAGLTIASCDLSLRAEGMSVFVFALRHVTSTSSPATPALVQELAKQVGVARVAWRAAT